ncbi:hypothetical protein LF95_16410 [Thalassospira sp. TSL5-1]|nr:hypothetical protein LF95_16410 [Thalassospira sp. TSL5-1]
MCAGMVRRGGDNDCCFVFGSGNRRIFTRFVALLYKSQGEIGSLPEISDYTLLTNNRDKRSQSFRSLSGGFIRLLFWPFGVKFKK